MKHFQLLETILWENGNFFLLKLHLERLKKSSTALSFALDGDLLLLSLKDQARSFSDNKKYRVRLVLDAAGTFRITSSEMEAILPDVPVRIRLSDKRVDNRVELLQHKTTDRDLYNEELTAGREQGYFETIFLNERNELTEGCISNILIEKNGMLYTPPVSCGLLPGVYRNYLLTSLEPAIQKKVLFEEDLLNSDNIYIINSVIKQVPALLDK
ncbi:MAG: aminotransferase class IV [Candidatus Tantalella remota]|nr:aminotransferase class IV [Candidatus Tantalella remota]